MGDRRGAYLWTGAGTSQTAKIIGACRRSSGKTQSEVAEALGVTRSRLAQWETDKRPLPLDIAKRLQDILQPKRPWVILNSWAARVGPIATITEAPREENVVTRPTRIAPQRR